MKSLAECVESALKDAAEAHKACCHEEPEWEHFYACFVAKRLAPIMASIQCLADKALEERLARLPVLATVNGKWSRYHSEVPENFDVQDHGRG